jgi:hypothetical protein
VTGVYTCPVDESNKFDIIMNVLNRRLIFDLIFSFYFMMAVWFIKINLLRYKKKITREGTLGDFIILIKNLPKDIDRVKEFYEIFNTSDNLLPVVKEINFIYDFGGIHLQRNEIRELN